jgi:serine-type anaerobic sulfatase-maturating enzyme
VFLPPDVKAAPASPVNRPPQHRVHSPQMPALLPFHVMAKPAGPSCNLDCTYCFYLEKEKLYPGRKDWRMSPAVLESFIRQHIAAQPDSFVQFSWQGGEPTLLGIDFFREVVRLQRKFAAGKKIENVLQTNGVLLDHSWAEFLAKHAFLVGISIDGPRQLHDEYRKDKGGQSTFENVMKTIALLKQHSVVFNTLTVVSRANALQPREVYRFLKSAGSEYMQFIPLVERQARVPGADGLTLVTPGFPGEADVTPWSVEPAAFGAFLCSIFDEWIRHDVGKHYVQIFEVALEIWYGMGSSLCAFQECCGMAMAMEQCGDLYSCDHYVYPEHKLGNILQSPLKHMAQSAQQRNFGAAKRDALPRYCCQCDVRYACNGECPKHRFLRTPDGKPGLNYLCEAYKRFFRHIAPYMQFMVRELRAGQAPANIMKVVGGRG